MRRPIIETALGALVAVSLVLLVVAPASATERPHVRISQNFATQENALALIRVEYTGATGTTATAAGSMWQGGTAGAPGTVYASQREYPLTCDGAEHEFGMALILVGWDEWTGIPPTPFLCDTPICGLKGNATVTITDSTGRADTDTRRLKIFSR
jgi:hypothetical protein